jgi:hypothetical protein
MTSECFATDRREPRRPPVRFFRGRLLLLGLLALAGSGCGEEERGLRFSRKTIAIGEVPEAVMKTAKTELPQVKFDEAWENLDAERKLQSYEIRGRMANGKIREVRVSPAGEILEME